MKCYLILYNNNEPFLYQIVTCSEKWFYMTISNDRLSGWTKQKLQSTSQSQTCTNKRVMVIVWWSTPCLIHYSFLNPGKTITSEKYAQQIDERCIENSNASIGQQKGPNFSPWQHPKTHCTTNASKAKWIGPQWFALSAIINWHLTNWLPLLQAYWQLFPGKMCPQLAGWRKCFPSINWIP